MAGVIQKIVFLWCLIACVPSVGQSLIFSDPERLPDSVNSADEESYPILSPDGKTLYFLRTKINDRGKISEQKIWYSERTESGWSAAKDNFPLNSKDGFSIIGFGANGQTVYLSKAFTSGKIEGVFVSRRFNNHWSKPTEIKIKNLHISSSFFGFYMHPSEKILLISMEGPASKGNEDLYVSTRNEKNEWSEPIHLGNSINTSGFEISPFLSEDGKTLFFSSNGHGGAGDAEILRSTRLYDSWTLWTQPVLAGPTVNSESFDSYFTMNGKEAFFVSNRGKKYADIYSVKADVSNTPSALKMSDAEIEMLFGFPIKRSFTFTNNSTTIAANDREILYYISNLLKDRGEYAIEIVGYSDKSKEEKNKAMERAENTRTILLNGGMEGYKILRTYENPNISSTKVELIFYRI